MKTELISTVTEHLEEEKILLEELSTKREQAKVNAPWMDVQLGIAWNTQNQIVESLERLLKKLK